MWRWCFVSQTTASWVNSSEDSFSWQREDEMFSKVLLRVRDVSISSKSAIFCRSIRPLCHSTKRREEKSWGNLCSVRSIALSLSISNENLADRSSHLVHYHLDCYSTTTIFLSVFSHSFLLASCSNRTTARTFRNISNNRCSNQETCEMTNLTKLRIRVSMFISLEWHWMGNRRSVGIKIWSSFFRFCRLIDGWVWWGTARPILNR